MKCLTILLAGCLHMAIALSCNASGGSYVNLNSGDDEPVPFTHKLAKGKIKLSWKKTGILERSTDLKHWYGIRRGRTYYVKPEEEYAYFRVRTALPRPTRMYLPKGYDPQKKYPLILNLHGFGGNGSWQESYFSLKSLADELGFAFCAPDGLFNDFGSQKWNATDGCCGGPDDITDDSGFLRGIIDSAMNRYSIDEDSIHVTGLSNGGFMSYRMAQDHSDIIASIAPVAGVGQWDKSLVKLKSPVQVLHIHATGDGVITWNGSFGSQPSVLDNIANWVEYNKCTEKTEEKKAIDVDSDSSDKETDIIKYTNPKNGCTVELWKVNGSRHVIPFTLESRRRIVKWMLEHRKIR